MTIHRLFPPASTLGVVLLGAGASSRMGRPKLLLPWGRTSVIGHLLHQWRALRARQIAVVCRAADQPLAAELDRLRFPARRRIDNPRPARGMFSSIVCAANWDGWDPAVTAWVIVLGDQPHLSRSTLGALLAFQRRHPHAVCQPAYGGHGRHPVILPRGAFMELKNSRAGTLKNFLKKTSVPIVQCPIVDRALALDFDRPEDYKRLLSFAKPSRHERLEP
ncbi:MAG: nucleotidyltransferase family protein [Verrucomicrobiota bacterium]|jgi:molybdenum cofactor cytidylyltransferase